ncbi:MerR family transcriptional regulator [Paenibacillus turpanensis]|uniref:MerR family transcriptional regulator n=1 Tax=Paenibacillus turpanensis TaxID=2689078 RepID=UPI00140C77A9|nr:MerR family transcriptional regulator [Paenibacillus turpanensis]
MLQQDQLFSIGQASRLCDIPIQTLRYYDRIGLVVPAETAPDSGYRYYSNLNILHIKIVQDLRSLDFSLEEIKQVLDRGSIDAVKAAFEARYEETCRNIQQLQQIASSIKQRTVQLDSLHTLGGEIREIDVLVERKCLPDRIVAFDRQRAACGLEASAVRFTKLFQQIAESGLHPDGHMMTIYHENIMTFDRSDSDLELCVPVSASAGTHAFIRTIPGGDYVTAAYCGIPNEESCKRIYRQALQWMDRNGLRENGPSIEQYLVDMTQIMNPESYIVELQIPAVSK